MADIAFFFWAKDLRTDLANTVPPYVPDLTTGITGTVSLPVGGDPLQNMEIYNNPANDPRPWQHMVEFMVTLGIAVTSSSRDDVDCTDPQNDLCKLREGQTNSAGITGGRCLHATHRRPSMTLARRRSTAAARTSVPLTRPRWCSI